MDWLSARPWFFCCIVPLIVLFLANFVFSDALHYLALVPANTLITHTYTWNLVTSCFLETNIAKLVVDIIAVWWLSGILGNPNVEQFGIYFCFSILASSIGVSMICFFRFVTLGIEGPLVIPLYGFSGVLISLAMFARQLLKSQLIFSKLPNFTYHHVPVVIVMSLLMLRVVGMKSCTEDFLFSCVSLLFSWSYLRFYYKFNDIDGFGDSSEEFTFVGMFPEVILRLFSFKVELY